MSSGCDGGGRGRRRDAPAYGGHNDFATTVLLAQMFAAGIRRLVLASSMVVYGQGRYACPEHGPVEPLPRRRADLDAGIFEHRCPLGGEELHWRLVDEDAALRPRSLYAASKTAQEHYALAWSESTGGSVVALRYHNVYGPGMPRDTPYSGVAAIFRSSIEKGESPKVFEDGGQMRDFVHVDDVAAANLAATAEVDGFTAVNVCSGRPISILEVAAALCDARGGALSPVVTGQYRSGDVRHIVADPARAADCWASVRPSTPRGSASVRVRPAALGVALMSEDMLEPDEVTVVLPCLNEAESLPGVLARFPPATGRWWWTTTAPMTPPGWPAATAPGVVELRAGYGAAVHAGVVAATTPIVAVIDADGSMDPADLPVWSPH